MKNFGVCDFSRLAVTDWRLWFLALMTATLKIQPPFCVERGLFVPYACSPKVQLQILGGNFVVYHVRKNGE